ncbi:TPA: hypothetical protein OR153_001038 [Escherichia coli]|nr:hypothetical protein [Escherichia coli]
MEIIKIWRGNSKVDGEYIRVIEDVNRCRFYELVYSEERENKYLNELTPMWCKVADLTLLKCRGFYTDYNTLTDAELVAILYEGE